MAPTKQPSSDLGGQLTIMNLISVPLTSCYLYLTWNRVTVSDFSVFLNTVVIIKYHAHLATVS